ncbi:Fic family protein, partial [Patescibacteria group bacterium]|nr:Fic family protein [Patescibacteria group bacterium]
MISKDVPYNSLPLIPPDFNFDDIDILKAVNEANKSLYSLKFAVMELKNPFLLVSLLSTIEARASSEIENINTTIAEVFQAELFDKKEISKPQKEVIYYKDAIIYGFNLIEQKSFLSTNDYINIQRILEPNKSGIRKLPGTKIVNTTLKKVIYTPPENEDFIRDLLKNFELFFNDNVNTIDPLIKVSILHYQFEAIHPFYDGNGRTGRILIVLYLILQKILPYPILFISGFILENKGDYYRNLNNITFENSWKNWVIYMLDAIRIQSEVTTSIVLKIKHLQKEYEDKLNKKFVFSSNTHKFIDYIFSTPFYTQKKATEKLHISRQTI